MNTIHRSPRVLAILAVLALLIAPAAGASEPQDRPTVDSVSVWNTALDLVAPIGSWFLEMIGASESVSRVEVEASSIDLKEANSSATTSRRSQGSIDPVGLDRD